MILVIIVLILSIIFITITPQEYRVNLLLKWKHKGGFQQSGVCPDSLNG